MEGVGEAIISPDFCLTITVASTKLSPEKKSANFGRGGLCFTTFYGRNYVAIGVSQSKS
jgi:hypothetical protein